MSHPFGNTAAPTPKVDEFVASIGQFVLERNALRIGEFLIVEPPFSLIYQELIAEVQRSYSPDNDVLEKRIAAALPLLAAEWPPFIKFLAQYFYFIVKVDINNLLLTYNLLSELFSKVTTALSNPEYGTCVLFAVLSYAKILARLAIGLDKQPHLIAHLRKSDDEDTLPEQAGNVIRQALGATLNDRSTSDPAAATSIKFGSLILANLWLKILFQCKKVRSAEFIFNLIPLQAPPLRMYPKPQQVTYLYYLGRYHFGNNHFYRAIQTLEGALEMCPAQFTRQRRLILVHLVTASIILGRFPSERLYGLPEAVGFAERFHPICKAIRTGDLYAFRVATDIRGEHAAWFLHHRILFQLQARCEPLVWRSLIRQVYMLKGSPGDPDRKIAPNLDLNYVTVAARYLETKFHLPLSHLDQGPGRRHTNFIFMATEPSTRSVFVHPEFEGIPEEERLKLIPTGKVPRASHQFKTSIPDLRETEVVVAALINQRLLKGYMAHRMKRFAIQGAKEKGGLLAGFPNVWETLTADQPSDVPGWKKNETSRVAGTTIRLSGVKAIGE